jgi:hypothetical protein
MDETVKAMNPRILVALVLALLMPCAVQAQDHKIIDAKTGQIRPSSDADFDDVLEPPVMVNSASPDGQWLFCFRHYGSHAEVNSLYRSGDGLKFVPVLKDFDKAAWKFFCKIEAVSSKDVEFVNPAEFVSWSPDGSRLFFSLTSRLGLTVKELDTPLRPSNRTASGYISPRADPKSRASQIGGRIAI